MLGLLPCPDAVPSAEKTSLRSAQHIFATDLPYQLTILGHRKRRRRSLMNTLADRQDIVSGVYNVDRGCHVLGHLPPSVSQS